MSTGDNSLDAMAAMLHVKQERPITLDHPFVDENAVSKSVIASRPMPKFPCAVNPCLHGGVCVTDSSQPNGRRCDCPSGYTGVLCSGMFFKYKKYEDRTPAQLPLSFHRQM